MSTFIQRLVATDAGFGPLALRLPVGIIFVAHGAQKLFGAFCGYGLEGTGQWMASIGLALLAVSVALLFSGGGRASVDRVLAARLAGAR